MVPVPNVVVLVASAYQLIVPEDGVAVNVTTDGPQLLTGELVAVMVGIKLMVATTAVLLVVHPQEVIPT